MHSGNGPNMCPNRKCAIPHSSRPIEMRQSHFLFDKIYPLVPYKGVITHIRWPRLGSKGAHGTAPPPRQPKHYCFKDKSETLLAFFRRQSYIDLRLWTRLKRMHKRTKQVYRQKTAWSTPWSIFKPFGARAFGQHAVHEIERLAITVKAVSYTHLRAHET